MFRRLNRRIQDFLREKRLKIGKILFDRKVRLKLIAGENFIIKNNINSILFLRYDGKIGDMVVNTFMFREIKKRYPNIKIGVVARGQNKKIIENNPFVDIIYDYNKKSVCNLAEKIRKDRYDLLIDFSEVLKVKQMMFINKCKCRFNIGLDKRDWQLFDISINSNEDFYWTDHITERYCAYLKKIGIIGNINSEYDIYNDENTKKFDYISYSNGVVKDYIVINPYGASNHKSFNLRTLEKLILFLQSYNLNIILLYYGDKIKELYQLSQLKNVIIPREISSINDSIYLISNSKLVITPDTSIVHIASALKKSGIAVYPPNGGQYGVDHIVWAPNYKDMTVIFCEDKKSKYDEIDINTFDMKEMEQFIVEKIEFKK